MVEKGYEELVIDVSGEEEGTLVEKLNNGIKIITKNTGKWNYILRGSQKIEESCSNYFQYGY